VLRSSADNSEIAAQKHHSAGLFGADRRKRSHCLNRGASALKKHGAPRVAPISGRWKTLLECSVDCQTTETMPAGRLKAADIISNAGLGYLARTRRIVNCTRCLKETQQQAVAQTATFTSYLGSSGHARALTVNRCWTCFTAARWCLQVARASNSCRVRFFLHSIRWWDYAAALKLGICRSQWTALITAADRAAAAAVPFTSNIVWTCRLSFVAERKILRNLGMRRAWTGRLKTQSKLWQNQPMSSTPRIQPEVIFWC